MSSRRAKPSRSKKPKGHATPSAPIAASALPPGAPLLDDERVGEDELTDRERAFVAAYFARRFNAAAAARELTGTTDISVSSSIGHRLRHRPRVAAEIERHLQAAQLASGEVLALLSDQARGDLGRYLSLTEAGVPAFDLEQLQRDGQTHLIKKIKRGADGTLTIEFHDSQAALDKLARVHGLYKDQLVVSTSVNLDELTEQVRAIEARMEGADDA